MALFYYQALERNGRKTKGMIEADSARHARQLLRGKDLIPVHIEARMNASAGGMLQRRRHAHRRVAAADLALFTRQLATLVQAAMPLETCLQAVSEQSEKLHVKSLGMALRSRIQEGYTLSDSLREHPRVFDSLFCSMVAAGEKSGHLDVVLNRLADYTEQRQRLKSRLLQAMLYPLVLLVVATGVVTILLTAVVPKIIEQFDHLGHALPASTRMLIAMSDTLQTSGVYWLAGLLGLLVLGQRLLKNPAMRLRWDKTLLRLPVTGRVARGLNTARFSRTLSILTASSVPLLEGIQTAAAVSANRYVEQQLLLAADRVREGSSLRAALAELDALNDQAQQSRRELDALERRAADLRQQTAQWQALAAQEQADACQQAAQAALTAQARADTLAADCSALPDDASLTLLEGQAAALPGELSALTEKRSAAEKAAQTVQQARNALEQHPLYPAAEPELRQRAEAIQPDRTPSLLLVLFPAALIVVAATLAFLFRAQQPLPFWLFIGMAGLGMIATLFAARSRRQAIVERHKYAETQRAALETQIAEYLPLRQQAEEAAEAARRAEVSAADSEDACRRRLRDLLTQVRVFAPAAADLSGIQLALSDARRRKTALADARQTAREAALYRDALRVQLPEQPAAESSIQRPALSREEAAAELARTQTLLAQERTRFDTLTGRIRALDRSSDLEAQLAQKQEQLTALQDEYDAIALAMDALSQANTVLQNRFSPALGRRAAEIFARLTDGRYSGVVLDRTFHLSAEPADERVYRDAALLSAGASDQLYLAVRLAICDLVLPQETCVPIVLDDALTNFDDDRCAAALRYLKEAAQTRQILLFTCHSREADFFAGDSDVSVVHLAAQ